MSKNKTFVLKAGGFILFLFAVVIAFVIFFAYQLILTSNPLILIFIGIIVLWAFFSTYLYIHGQKIEISDAKFTAYVPVKKFGVFPRFEVKEINIQNISKVTIATTNFFRKHSAEYSDENLKDLMSRYKTQSWKPSHQILMEVAARTTPLLFVGTKDASLGIALTTKPFSKSGFQNLVSELKKRKISVVIDPKTGLSG